MTKKNKKEPKLEIMSLEDLMPKKPKVKLNDKKVQAIETILKDEALRRLDRAELENIVDAYKSGKRGKSK